MQSPWAKARQSGARSKESDSGSYGCRVSSGCHSNLEQSAVVMFFVCMCVYKCVCIYLDIDVDIDRNAWLNIFNNVCCTKTEFYVFPL